MARQMVDPYWADLPSAPLAAVLRALRPRDRARAACACRAWRAAAACALVWEVVDLEDEGEVAARKFLYAAIARAPDWPETFRATRELRLPAGFVMTAATFSVVCETFPSLREVHAKISVHTGADAAALRAFCARGGARVARLRVDADRVAADAADAADALECARALDVSELTVNTFDPRRFSFRALAGANRFRRLAALHVPCVSVGDDASVRALVDFIGNTPTLVVLDLYDCALGDHGAAAVAVAARAARAAGRPRLRVDLGLNGVRSGAAREIALSVVAGAFEALSVRGASLGHEDATSLAAAVARDGAMLRLDLSGTYVPEAAMRRLAAALAGGCALTHLSLDYPVGRLRGTRALAAALRDGCNLRLLGLRRARLNARSATALLCAVRSNETLEALGLDRAINHSSDEMLDALRQMIADNEHLWELCISGNNLRDAGGAAVAAGLAGNRALRVLHAQHNRFGEAGVAAMCGALRENTTLKQLFMFGNHAATGFAAVTDGATVDGEEALKCRLSERFVVCK